MNTKNRRLGLEEGVTATTYLLPFLLPSPEAGAIITLGRPVIEKKDGACIASETTREYNCEQNVCGAAKPNRQFTFSFQLKYSILSVFKKHWREKNHALAKLLNIYKFFTIRFLACNVKTNTTEIQTKSTKIPCRLIAW